MYFFSVPSDIQSAIPYAYQLQQNNDSLVVVGIGPNVDRGTLYQLAASTSFVFVSPNYDGDEQFAYDINNAICNPAPPSPTSTSSTMYD